MMSSISKRRREGPRTKIKTMGDHKDFLKRITKTLYYGQLPSLPCLSLPVTEISCELWSEAQRGRSLRRLHADAAAGIARSACVSPCALVLAILYLERLNTRNPDYLVTTAPADLFLISLMVSNKFLQDDGEDEEVICSEWATSGGLELDQLKKLELEFLNAIDWNIFVSEKSFESCLRRLERRVALRQAQLRGFFTYGDLAASCDAAPLGELVRCAAGCLVLSLGYVAGLLALVTSALVASHAWLPALHYVATTGVAVPDSVCATNATLPVPAALPTDRDSPEDEAPCEPTCCTDWLRYRADCGDRSDGVAVYDVWIEPWGAGASVLDWLYRSSPVNPMQRWLERMAEYAETYADGAGRCERAPSARRRLDLSKLSALLATVSDR